VKGGVCYLVISLVISLVIFFSAHLLVDLILMAHHSLDLSHRAHRALLSRSYRVIEQVSASKIKPLTQQASTIIYTALYTAL
jgi:hypothetical protein